MLDLTNIPGAFGYIDLFLGTNDTCITNKFPRYLMNVFVLISKGGSFDRSIRAKCLDLNVVVYANVGISIFQDILILLLPIPEGVYLNIQAKKKVIPI